MAARYNRSLADWLQQRGPGTLSPQEIVHLVRQAASTLQDVHNRRMVYRNVNPRNFLISPDEATRACPTCNSLILAVVLLLPLAFLLSVSRLPTTRFILPRNNGVVWPS